MKIIIETEQPIIGWWDGGAKSRFEFEPEYTKSDDEGEYIKWGSWSANYWFHTSQGKTDKLSAMYAIRHLKAVLKPKTTYKIYSVID